MATTTGKVTGASRQGTGSAQTRTVTIETSAGPPPVEVVFSDVDEDFYRDATAFVGKTAIVTYTPSPSDPATGTVTGIKGKP